MNSYFTSFDKFASFMAERNYMSDTQENIMDHWHTYMIFELKNAVNELTKLARDK